MNFSATITYGEILQAAVVAIGGIGVFYQMQSRLGAVEKELNKLAEVTIRIAQFDERQKAQDHRITRLEDASAT